MKDYIYNIKCKMSQVVPEMKILIFISLIAALEKCFWFRNPLIKSWIPLQEAYLSNSFSSYNSDDHNIYLSETKYFRAEKIDIKTYFLHH